MQKNKLHKKLIFCRNVKYYLKKNYLLPIPILKLFYIKCDIKNHYFLLSMCFMIIILQ